MVLKLPYWLTFIYQTCLYSFICSFKKLVVFWCIALCIERHCRHKDRSYLLKCLMWNMINSCNAFAKLDRKFRHVLLVILDFASSLCSPFGLSHPYKITRWDFYIVSNIQVTKSNDILDVSRMYKPVFFYHLSCPSAKNTWSKPIRITLGPFKNKYMFFVIVILLNF